jgi:hypothetical protein
VAWLQITVAGMAHWLYVKYAQRGKIANYLQFLCVIFRAFSFTYNIGKASTAVALTQSSPPPRANQP